VVAELELNSVIPPPDTKIEEDDASLIRCVSQFLLKQLKTGNKFISHLWHDERKGYRSLAYNDDQPKHDVDSKVLKITTSVNDRISLLPLGTTKRQTSLFTVVAELELNSVNPPPDTTKREMNLVGKSN
jgi:hypothetical protein